MGQMPPPHIRAGGPPLNGPNASPTFPDKKLIWGFGNLGEKHKTMRLALDFRVLRNES